MGFLCKGIDGNDEVMVSSFADVVENFIWHECKTSKISGE